MTKVKDYKTLRNELDQVLEWFEQDDFDLDEAVKKYEQGLALVKELEDYLKTAENKIEKLKNLK